jgi:hypothetical protein
MNRILNYLDRVWNIHVRGYGSQMRMSEVLERGVIYRTQQQIHAHNRASWYTKTLIKVSISRILLVCLFASEESTASMLRVEVSAFTSSALSLVRF